jgi:NAD(P)-dependent dehydrogenase (short-subunit alcohol dehydrogenase family)
MASASRFIIWGSRRTRSRTSLHKASDQTTEEELDRIYNVHFKGVCFLTQKLWPLLNDGGRIVNGSSGLARFRTPGAAAYASMKGAVEVLTRYLARELGSRGIAVNTVAPGAIATDFSGGVVRDNPEVNRRVAEMRTPPRPPRKKGHRRGRVIHAFFQNGPHDRRPQGTIN